MPSWRVTSPATAGSTWPSPTSTTTPCRCCWATATAPSSPRSPTRSGRSRTPSWRATSPATADLDLAVANCRRQHRLGAAGQRRRHVPAPGHLRGRVGPDRHRGGRLHRRRPPRPGRRQRRTATRCRCCWATATARSSPRSPTRSGSSPTRSWRATSPATADLDLAVANQRRQRRCRCCWATATAPSSPRSPTRSGSDPDAIVAGDFTGDGHLDLAVANAAPTARCRCCWATATARSSPRSPTRSGRSQPRSWRATSPATAASTWPSPTQSSGTVSVLLGNGDGTFQPQVTYAVGIGPGRHRGGRLHRRRPPRPGRREPAASGTVSVLLGNGDGTFQPQVER